jgi:putative Mn2+ efflux pump MntP
MICLSAEDPYAPGRDSESQENLTATGGERRIAVRNWSAEGLTTLNILAIALGLAMDAFAVSIAASILLSGATPRQVFRIAFHFGLFQFLMPILGWTAGQTVEPMVRAWDHWLAFGLLTFIGGKILLGGLSPDRRSQSVDDPSRGLTLVALSVATSVDALAVGLSFAFLRVSILIPSVIIGAVAGLLSTVGMCSGARLGAIFGRRVEILGGLLLIVIGLKILAEHLI